MNRAFIYSRASLDATGEGRSVERQAEACRAVAQLRGLAVAEEITDNSISAYGEKRRPGWERVLAAIEANEIDYVVSWHMDRMTRSILELERLILLCEEHGVGIITATGDIDLTTDVGRMVARILGAVARAEVERKAARQRLANAQAAADGRPFTGGTRPFGYERDQLTVIEAEADAIRSGAVDALAGASMESIARDWTDLGLREEPWTGRGVKHVLTSPRYAAIRTHKGAEIGPAQWPAILDMDTHLALRTALAPSATKGRAGNAVENLLSLVATCEQCGARLRAGSVAFSGKTKLVYSCPSSHVNPPREDMDAEVSAAIVGLLCQPDFVASLLPAGDEEAEEIRADLDALHRRAKVLALGFAGGSVDETTFLEAGKSIQDRIKARELELRAVASGSVLDGLHVGTELIVEEWERLPLVRQRAIIDQFLDVVAVRKAGGRTKWRPELHLKVERKKALTPTLG